MKLWIEVFVESRPQDTNVYTAQEVVRYDTGNIETTYLDSGIDRVDIEGIAHLPSFNVTLIIIISICFLFWLSFERVCLSKLSTHGLDFALASQEDENASWR